MENYKATILNVVAMLLLLVPISCDNDENCEYTTCISNAPNSALAGWTVATCHSRRLGDPVGVIYNTSQNSTAPIADDWGSNGLNTVANTIHPISWTPANIGQVFGIAIDNNENIYLAASHIYDQSGTITLTNTNPGQVYKSSGHPTWNTVPLFSLPNTGGNLNGTEILLMIK